MYASIGICMHLIFLVHFLTVIIEYVLVVLPPALNLAPNPDPEEDPTQKTTDDFVTMKKLTDCRNTIYLLNETQLI